MPRPGGESSHKYTHSTASGTSSWRGKGSDGPSTAYRPHPGRGRGRGGSGGLAPSNGPTAGEPVSQSTSDNPRAPQGADSSERGKWVDVQTLAGDLWSGKRSPKDVAAAVVENTTSQKGDNRCKKLAEALYQAAVKSSDVRGGLHLLMQLFKEIEAKHTAAHECCLAYYNCVFNPWFDDGVRRAPTFMDVIVLKF